MLFPWILVQLSPHEKAASSAKLRNLLFKPLKLINSKESTNQASSAETPKIPAFKPLKLINSKKSTNQASSAENPKIPAFKPLRRFDKI